MTCTHCGQAPIAMEYSIRFAPTGRPPRTMDLHLCDACLTTMCREEGVELVEEPVQGPVGSPAR